MLLSLEQDQQALIRAIESYDADLGNLLILIIVFLVLFHLRKKLPLGDFFRAINDYKFACDLLIAYCNHQDHDLLRDFFYQDDRRLEASNLTLVESFDEKVLS